MVEKRVEEKMAWVRRKSVPGRDKGISSGDEGWASSVSEVGGVAVSWVRRSRRYEESPRLRSFARACAH